MQRTEGSSTARRRRWLRLIALPVLIGLAGYAIGRSAREVPESAALQWSPRTEPAAADRPANDESTADQREVFVKELKDRLQYLWRSSPDPFRDWEVKRETRQLLAKLTTAELEAWFRSSEEAVTSAEHFLRSEILKSWAQRDGPAAVTRCSTGKDDPSISAFISWAEVDREAALHWLRDVELPPHVGSRKSSLRVNFLLRLVRYDFDRVTQELPFMDAAERASTLNALALNAPDDPAARERLRKLTAESPDEAESIRMESSLLTRLAQTDPAAARARVDAMDLTPERRAQLEFGILYGAANNHPAEAYAEWVAHHPAEQPLPETFWPLLDQSLSFRTEPMIAWMDSLEAGSVRDAIYERGTRLVAAKQNFTKAAEYATGIADPARRGPALEVLKVMWSEGDPDGARQWLEGLGEADRKALAK
ncbi:hypothetical protein [Luteolibacter sp. Populi]|uniref:hypothetical protein n=1 Tax=Luteolibacter sp. Populi TaxID=3230487 RepID=UPI0034673DA9